MKPITEVHKIAKRSVGPMKEEITNVASSWAGAASGIELSDHAE
jgi:hypothetical protein